MPDAAPAARGVYKPRRPQASPLFRLVSDHLHRLQTVYDERFAREYGPWRPVVAQVADKFLACGVLEHGFARIRCDDCAHEYLLAFSCKCRYFCPSCHAKRLAIWTQWLDTTLLAPVPHRQVVLTIPKRLRAYCLYRRRLLGEIARVAARTVTAAIRTLTGERDLAVGIVACLQTHGSRANWHPHLHLLVTDGGFRPDGTFVSWPVHDTARLTEAFRRAVLRLFVRLELFDEDAGRRHAHVAALGVPRAHRRVGPGGRSRVRHPARAVLRAESRRAGAADVRPRREGGDVPVRQVRGPNGGHRDRGPAGVPGPGAGAHPRQGPRHDAVLWLVCQPPARHAATGGARRSRRAARDRPRADGWRPTEATRRWAALLQQIFEVDPLACPTCHGAMRIVAFITQTSVIDQILTHLRTRAARAAHAGPRSPPSTRAPASRGASRAPRPSADAPTGHLSPAPTPRHHAGTVRRGRPSHRRVRLVPAGIAPPR